MKYFLLCAYNEGKNIQEVIRSIRVHFKNDYKIIVVDDGSTDNTEKDLEKILSDDILIIRHKTNLGLGVAIKTGLFEILSTISGDDIVITMDADNTHPINLVSAMIDKINQGYDLVIASRYVEGSVQYGVNVIRKFLSFSARIILKILFSYVNLNDYTSGYRAYSGRLLKKMFEDYGEKLVTEKNFTVQFELLVKSFSFQPRVCEVPLRLEYYKKYGKSKLKIIKNIISYMKLIIKLKMGKNS